MKTNCERSHACVRAYVRACVRRVHGCLACGWGGLGASVCAWTV